MPLGYMALEMSVDGYPVNVEELLHRGEEWERYTDIKTGVVHTSYKVNRGIRIMVEHVLPMQSINIWRDGGFSESNLVEGIRLGAYGQGYFSEFFLEGNHGRHAPYLANLPPFATAHGAYLYAVIEHFIRDSLWESVLEIGPVPGSSRTCKPWSVHNVRTLTGALVWAEGDENTVCGGIKTTKDRGVKIILERPPKLAGNRAGLIAGGITVFFDFDETISFFVDAGDEIEFKVFIR